MCKLSFADGKFKNEKVFQNCRVLHRNQHFEADNAVQGDGNIACVNYPLQVVN